MCIRDRDYIDLTLDQFPGYQNRIVAEPVESGGQLAADLNREPAISTADGIVASPSDKVNYITEQKNRQPMAVSYTHLSIAKSSSAFVCGTLIRIPSHVKRDTIKVLCGG